MTAKAPNIVLAGGGTGGHVIPAIAVAEEMDRRGGNARFVGTADRLEARLVPAAGFGIDFINVSPLAGGGIKRKMVGLASVPMAVFRSARLLSRLSPDVVIGVGGYVAGPVVLAARLIGIPTALLEQNATVGLTNKLLARVVNMAFVSYEETIEEFPKGKAEFSGNPVKQSILDAAQKNKPSHDDGLVRILVMGGSQGARAIDDRVPEALDLAGVGGKVKVLHQSGGGREEEVIKRYKKANIEASVVSFIEDTASAFLEADMIVARSGATTVAEVTVMGLPAVFLPYPHHTDRQQEKNAKPMANNGAARVFDEKTTGVQDMADAIAAWVNDSALRQKAADASKELGHPDAASFVADGLEKLSRK